MLSYLADRTVLYTNTTLSVILTGVVMKPLNDRLKVSHEKQAFIIKVIRAASLWSDSFGAMGRHPLWLDNGCRNRQSV